MTLMSDRELEAIKKRKLQALQQRMNSQAQKEETPDANVILNKIFEGRAWEVFNTACTQFPNEMAKVKHLLVSLALEKKINKIDGEQLFTLLREIGLPIRLNTTIRVVGHGKTKLLSEKFKESIK